MRPECRELMRYWLKAAHTNAIARFLGLAQPLTTREVEVLDRPTTRRAGEEIAVPAAAFCCPLALVPATSRRAQNSGWNRRIGAVAAVRKSEAPPGFDRASLSF